MSPSLERPVFVSGAGRSGTTLLRSLLSAHSRLGIAPETHFLERVTHRRRGVQTDLATDFEEFWERYTNQIRFRDLGIEKGRCRELMELEGEPSFQGMFRAMLIAYSERTGKARVGEKTPSHVRFIPHLLDWFPDASILVARRDPRAVVASQLRSLWVQRRFTPPSLRRGMLVGSRIHQAAFYADDWWHIYEEVLPRWSDDPRVRAVAYEALVREPEAELRRICDFLGEDFEPKMLEQRDPDDVPEPASKLSDEEWKEWRKEHHEKARRPIFSTSLDKWKEQLSEVTVALVEGRCAGGMRRAGYDFTTNPLTRTAGRQAVRFLMRAEPVEDRARQLARRVYHGIRRRVSPA